MATTIAADPGQLAKCLSDIVDIFHTSFRALILNCRRFGPIRVCLDRECENGYGVVEDKAAVRDGNLVIERA